MLKIFPTLEDFQSFARSSNLIAVSAEINTDLDTPVSIFYKIVEDGRGFILESVDTTQQAFGRFSFVGAEPFVELQVFKSKIIFRDGDLMKSIEGQPVDAIKKFMSRYKPAALDKNLPLANGGMVGYFNFEVAATFDRIRGLSLGEEELLGQFMICRVLIVLDALKNSARMIYFANVSAQDNLPELYAEITARMNQIAEKISEPLKISPPEKISHAPINLMARYGTAPPEVLAAIERAKEYIFAGDIFQVVPSKQFRAKISKPAFLFYRKLRQVNPSPYMFYLNFGSVKLVGASPEMLVKVAGKKVLTYPIAGTRRRGKNSDEDFALAADLKSDVKENAEHSMLVDLARNDLGRICAAGTVKVDKLREVEYFSHVMHMVSSVVGKLKENFTPIDVLKATFPAGTVSGAPKLRAMEIIHELEPVRRKSYAGTVGYMDFCGNMDMCITLRTMRIENDVDAVIQTGAGIVADSVPLNEYREFLQKAKALFEVVEEVENNDSPA
ncbi:MAG: anthranilate synthase component I family protein [Selenomonadaceae bacterium]|nr:anthranilate synthase component I family protein [Selenomonadaceae bacterium]